MLTRWNEFGALGRSRDSRPLDAFDELRREMNRLFFDFESGLPLLDPETTAWPAVSLEDVGPALLVRAEVPGLSEKDVEINVDENTLTLKGERRDEVPAGYTVHRKERAAFRFSRSFALPVKVDAEKAEASLKNGVLSVTLPKAKEAQPRPINVKAS